jgi:hydrogenase maturation factor
VKAYDADPLSASSFGSILIASPEENVSSIVKALERFGRPARETGYFFEGDGVIVKKNKGESKLEIRQDIYGHFTRNLRRLQLD